MSALVHAIASFVLRGPLHAIGVSMCCAALSLLAPPLSSPISYISGAGVGLVGLRHGLRQALLVVLGASLLLGLFGAAVLGGPFIGLAFMLAVWLPVGILALALRHTGSLAFAMEIAALLGVLMVAALHLAVGDVTAWWRELLEMSLKPALEGSAAMRDGARLETLLDELARSFTALLAGTSVLSWMISLFIARWWQAMLYNAGGFRREFHDLRLSRRLALPALAVMALSILGEGGISQLAVELLVVMLVLYMVQGIALAHDVVARRALHKAWLVALYVLLVVAPKQFVVLLAMAGLAHSWFNLSAMLGVADRKSSR